MTDATRIATLEAQLEVVALARDECREMLREMGRENAKLRANLAVMTEAYRDHRAALMAVTEDAPSPTTPSEGRCQYGATVCTHAQCQGGSGRATPRGDR